MEQPIQSPPKKSGCSLPTILIGCGVLMLVGVIALAVGGYMAYRWGMQQVDEFAAKYEAEGYERVTTQMIVESEPIDSPKVYTAQMVSIKTDVEADLAIMAQIVEIEGTVNGDIDFLGQLLTVKRGGAVTGEIRCEGAQVIQIDGACGEVTGDYQVLNWPGRQADAGVDEEAAAEPAEPSEPAAETVPE